MPVSRWDEGIQLLQSLIMKPVQFNDISITLIDAVNAKHDEGWYVEDHRHPWFEFNYVSEGCFCTAIEGIEFTAEQGEFFIIPPGVYHNNRTKVKDDGFCLRWQIEVIGQGEQKYDHNGAYKFIDVLTQIRPYSIRNDLIKSFIENIGTSGPLGMQISLVKLIVSMYELWNDVENEVKIKGSRDEVLVQQVLLYLDEYYVGHISVNDIADSLNVSYRHLARIFKKQTGITIIEKLNDIRVSHAKNLLRDTDSTIKEIAQKVGFENEYYFSNTFSQYTFSAPSEFRRKFKAHK